MSAMLPVTTDPPVRVWKMNDYDWVAARTLREAINEYCSVTGCARFQAVEDKPEALDDSEMRRLTFLTDEEEPGAPGSLKRHSYAVELALRIARGEQFPQMFASTEY